MASMVVLHSSDSVMSQIFNSGAYNCANPGPSPHLCPLIGKVTHFGRTLEEGLDLAMNSKVTGPVIYHSGGWYMKLFGGNPRNLRINSIQLNPDTNLLLAIPYPSGTNFVIRYVGPSWCGYCSTTFPQVFSVADVEAAHGDRWYFDTSNQVLYVKLVMKREPANLGSPHVDWVKESAQTLDHFTREGLTIWKDASQHWLEIQASSCGTGSSSDRCAEVAVDTIPGERRNRPPTTSLSFAPTPPSPQPTRSEDKCTSRNWGSCGERGVFGCCVDTDFTCDVVIEEYYQCRTSEPRGKFEQCGVAYSDGTPAFIGTCADAGWTCQPGSQGQHQPDGWYRCLPESSSTCISGGQWTYCGDQMDTATCCDSNLACDTSSYWWHSCQPV